MEIHMLGGRVKLLFDASKYLTIMEMLENSQLITIILLCTFARVNFIISILQQAR